MKNKGFSLLELLVVMFIATFVFAVMFGMFLVGNKTWIIGSAYIDLQQEARKAMNRMVDELVETSSLNIAITDCTDECYGDKITFQIPIVNDSPIANTIYHDDTQRTIKWGAYDSNGRGIEGAIIEYLVNKGAENDHKLMRIFDRTEGGAIPQPPPEDPGNNCFLAGTLILMSDNTLKPIETIKAGEQVLSFNEKTKQKEVAKVIKTSNHQADSYVLVNGRLKVTGNHPIFSQGKWLPIENLKLGDELLNSQGKPEKVFSLSLVKQKNQVYDLEVAQLHNYFAEGLLVHNKLGIGECDGNWCKLLLRIKKLVLNYFERPAFAVLYIVRDSSQVIANDIEEITFEGSTSSILIIIRAKKSTLMGDAELTLQSRVNPLN